MQLDPVEEWRSLTEHYSQISDDELLELAADFFDLRESAQQILRDELKRRGLDLPRPGDQSAQIPPQALPPWEDSDPTPPDLHCPQSSPDADEEGEDEEDSPHEFTWKTLLCECNDRAEAWQVYELLRRAGIESWIDTRPERYSQGLVSPRVMVAADQLEQARAIAAAPIPPEIVEESKAPAEEFDLPTCPECGAADPVLEGVDPVNRWQCEACGAEWTDPANSANEESPSARE